jgi:AcrR family transcriptional regulator
MAQRVTFTKQKIVEAAFDLTREKGWGFVTARTLARKLGSSTMPLYSSLRSMEEIQTSVRGRAAQLMYDFQRRAYTDNGLMNAAIGYVSFAREESNLFRFLYDRPDSPLQALPSSARANTTPPHAFDVNGIYDLDDQPAAAIQDPMVLMNWIFVHGLASLVAGKVIELSEDRISSLIQEAAASFSMYQTYTKGETK